MQRHRRKKKSTLSNRVVSDIETEERTFLYRSSRANRGEKFDAHGLTRGSLTAAGTTGPRDNGGNFVSPLVEKSRGLPSSTATAAATAVAEAKSAGKREVTRDRRPLCVITNRPTRTVLFNRAKVQEVHTRSNPFFPYASFFPPSASPSTLRSASWMRAEKKGGGGRSRKKKRKKKEKRREVEMRPSEKTRSGRMSKYLSGQMISLG